MTRRRRLSGEEARQRILEAAIERLRARGPEALKLTALAKELGVSHQAILYHFESRDGLLAAVLRQAIEGMQAQLADRRRAAAQGSAPGMRDLIDHGFEVMADQGHGRLLAWLALGHSEESAPADLPRPVELLTYLVHATRTRPGRGEVDRRETTFLMILLSYVVLGTAIFEPGMFLAAGLGDDPTARTEFRTWFRELLVGLLHGDGGGERGGGDDGESRVVQSGETFVRSAEAAEE